MMDSPEGFLQPAAAHEHLSSALGMQTRVPVQAALATLSTGEPSAAANACEARVI